jgi:hypothetical protein
VRLLSRVFSGGGGAVQFAATERRTSSRLLTGKLRYDYFIIEKSSAFAVGLASSDRPSGKECLAPLPKAQAPLRHELRPAGRHHRRAHRGDGGGDPLLTQAGSRAPRQLWCMRGRLTAFDVACARMVLHLVFA